MRKPRIETKPRKTKLTCENAYLLKDAEWLRFHYFEKDMSLRMIGALIPCSSLTIRRALVRHNIAIKPKHITYGDIKQPPRHSYHNGMWKGGNNKCVDCNKLLATRTALRCVTCKGLSVRGEKNPCWLPPEQRKVTQSEQIRQSVEYKEWRIKVWSRDKTKCKVCGIRKDPMVAHHLEGFNIFPEKRFDVDNGVTLCDKHHIAFHTNYGFGNNTKSQFEEYLEQTTEMTY
jgi:hypothetical protein